MKTRHQILNILRKFDGCQVTASQIRAELIKPIGVSTVNWHIQKLVKAEIIYVENKPSSQYGNVIHIKK